MRTRRIYRNKGGKKGTRSTNKSSTNTYSHQNIIKMFLQMVNTVKLYHWKTSSYAQHKATDELHGELNSNIDSFVEIMLGKDGSRVNLMDTKTLPLFDFTNVEQLKAEVEKYKKFLIGMNDASNLATTTNSDLLNVRDEILGSLNKFTYLLTLK